MRRIKWLDVTNVDTQQCLWMLNEKLPELGIGESDIISIQRQWNDEPVKILDEEDEYAWCTLFVFYWSD